MYVLHDDIASSISSIVNSMVVFILSIGCRVDTKRTVMACEGFNTGEH